MTPLKADSCLILVAAIWGMGFVAQRLGMDHVTPMLFTAARFGLGAIVILLFAVCVKLFAADKTPTPTTFNQRTIIIGGALVHVHAARRAGNQFRQAVAREAG